MHNDNPCESRIGAYRPQVGDKVKVPHYIGLKTVTAVGRRHVLVEDGACEWPVSIADATKVVEYPEAWVNVMRWGLGMPCESRHAADSRDGTRRRIGLLHLRKDGTTEMLAP